LLPQGVIVAKKDYNLAKHPDIEEASNLEVIKLMTSLTSKDLVSCRFCWKHYYWFLNDTGIEWLREYLHLPEDHLPNPLKKGAATRPEPPRPPRDPSDRPPRDGHMAFVRSPDGISIELLQKGESLPPQEPWLSMPNTGAW
jgi:small subunit ribosomal protein S10e